MYAIGDYVRIRPNAIALDPQCRGRVVRCTGHTRGGRSVEGRYYCGQSANGASIYFLLEEVLPATEEDFLLDLLEH